MAPNHASTSRREEINHNWLQMNELEIVDLLSAFKNTELQSASFKQGRISLLGGPRLKYVRGPFHYDKQMVDHKNNIALNQAFI